MSRTERREYVVGIFAAGTLAAVLVLTALANRQTVSLGDNLFWLTADFGQVDGIYAGSPVRVGGIGVGAVSHMSLNAQSQAVLTLQFYDHIPLSEDTAAVIETDGIFGSKYIELYPGGSDLMLESGARISYTQDSVILEELVALIVNRAISASRSQAPAD